MPYCHMLPHPADPPKYGDFGTSFGTPWDLIWDPSGRLRTSQDIPGPLWRVQINAGDLWRPDLGPLWDPIWDPIWDPFGDPYLEGTDTMPICRYCAICRLSQRAIMGTYRHSTMPYCHMLPHPADPPKYGDFGTSFGTPWDLIWDPSGRLRTSQDIPGPLWRVQINAGDLWRPDLGPLRTLFGTLLGPLLGPLLGDPRTPGPLPYRPIHRWRA